MNRAAASMLVAYRLVAPANNYYPCGSTAAFCFAPLDSAPAASIGSGSMRIGFADSIVVEIAIQPGWQRPNHAVHFRGSHSERVDLRYRRTTDAIRDTDCIYC